MKPAWDKLMEKYAEDESILVADVDCIGAGKSKCDDVGVKGFPTIKHGDPHDLEDYKGGRDYEALEKFVEELWGLGLGPMGSFWGLAGELRTLIEEQEALSEKAEDELAELLKKLQEQYEAGQKAGKRQEMTQGKAVFLKFFTPWCGQCKTMKPAWDALMEGISHLQEFRDDDTVLVAEVDCVGSGKAKCKELDIKAYPEVKQLG
eukprot:Skav224331  [mRNA]  locus=scaffold1353:208175:212924:- [translate_table: standard]